MSQKNFREIIRANLILPVIVLIVVSLFFLWPKSRPQSTNTLQDQAQVLQEHGQTIIVLAPVLQKKVGITSDPVIGEKDLTTTQNEYAYGAVMILPDVSDLFSRMVLAHADLSRAKANSITAHAAYQKAHATGQSARAALQKVQVNLAISRKAYDRLRELNADNRNVSAKTVESAEGTYQGTQSDILAAQAQSQSSRADLMTAQGQIQLNRADLLAAEGSLKSIREAALQRLGPVISRWMLSGNVQFDRLLQRQDVLVQITLPAQQSPPQSVRLQTVDQSVFTARYVAPAIQVDPKVQGASFTYLVNNARGVLLPGMNVTAALPIKKTGTGQQYSILASAVIWWEGKPWAYVQIQPDRFIRRRVEGKSVQDRWLVKEGFTLGDRLVTQGAQLLLSQEFQNRFQGE